MFVKKKYFLLGIIFGIILLSLGIIFWVRFFKPKRKSLISVRKVRDLREMGEVGETIRAPASPAPPTPTPTLTPQQLAEIRRRKFNELNEKYGPCKYISILMYHHIMDAKKAKEISASNLNVPPEIFREQMDYLIGKGYSIIGLDEMMNGLKNNSLPGKSVVLTFDDGYRDFFDSAFSILREKNLKATVFVITQYVGGERYLEWWQIREMANSGLILIGDHTLNHPYVPKLSWDEERNQIVSAKNILEQYTGRSINFFAYPYGSANQTAKEILKDNGFLGAVITGNANPQCAGLPYELSRIRIGASSLARYGL